MAEKIVELTDRNVVVPVDFTKVSNTVPAYLDDEVDFTKIEMLLPIPVGYQLLIAMPKVDDKTAGNVFLDPEYIQREKTASIIGLVVAMGAECYADEKKFKAPWCKVGDWVMFRSYSGARLRINEEEFRLLNDDSISAIIPDPRAIKRAY